MWDAEFGEVGVAANNVIQHVVMIGTLGLTLRADSGLRFQSNIKLLDALR
jgi:hypothetical protein